MIFSTKFLLVCGEQKGAGAAILNFGSGYRRQSNFGSSAVGSTTLTNKNSTVPFFPHIEKW
jgi:hypothetical protein